LDIDTCVRQFLANSFRFCQFRMTLIVAVKMENHQLAQSVVVAVPIKMVEFHQVSISEVQFTPATFPLLLLKEFRLRLAE
jgi:hypothetical protein